MDRQLKDEHGRALFTGVTRKAVCARCGKTFTQHQLSLWMYEWARTLAERDGPVKQTPLEREIPDGYVPLHCVPCERLDLQRTARD
jgi:hypothetical protein